MPVSQGKTEAIISMAEARYATLRLVMPLAPAIPMLVVAVDWIGPPSRPETAVPSALPRMPLSIDLQFGFLK